MSEILKKLLVVCCSLAMCLLCACGTISTEEASSYTDVEASADAEAGTCTIAIDCKTVLDNMDKLDKAKTAIIPEDGVILAETVVHYNAGDSVLDVLKQVTRDNKIAMEFEDSPAYGGGYVEGIANLYEFDCGDTSGWEFCVNGWFPNYSSENYEVGDGDVILWRYSCDNGKDIETE